MRLAKVFILFTGLLFSVVSFASDSDELTLNKITVNLSTEHWITSDTAKVTISVNATLQSEGLAELQQKILTDLNSVHEGDWRITNYYRSQDQSGLERANIQAEGRLPASSLTDIRQKAKDLSKPGEKFTISNIDYSPSFAEMNKAKAEMRDALYKNAIKELATINSLYPSQHYEVNNLVVVSAGMERMMPAYNKAMARGVTMMADSTSVASKGGSMSVSQRLELSALVTFAASFDGGKEMAG